MLIPGGTGFTRFWDKMTKRKSPSVKEHSHPAANITYNGDRPGRAKMLGQHSEMNVSLRQSYWSQQIRSSFLLPATSPPRQT